MYSEFKQVRVKFGDIEYRLASDYRDPFPLYPGETAEGNVTLLEIVPRYSAIRLRANREFLDGKTERYAGEDWQIEGPLVYIPRVEVDVISIITPKVVTLNNGIHLRAIKDCVDSEGVKRRAGEEWLHIKIGSYLPTPNEQVVRNKEGVILSENNAVHLRATKTFTDIYGVERLAGQEWLITRNQAKIHIPNVYEEVVKNV